MSIDPVKNLTKVVVSTGYDQNATSIVLSTGQGALLPNPATLGAFNLIWHNFTDYPDPSDDPSVEIIRVTAIIGDTLTVTRAQESTTASAKNASGKTYKMILGLTAKMISDIVALIPSQLTIKPLLVSGTIDGSNTAFTIPQSFTGKSVIALAGQLFIQDVDYTVSGDNVTYLSPVPSGYAGQSHYLICVA